MKVTSEFPFQFLFLQFQQIQNSTNSQSFILKDTYILGRGWGGEGLQSEHDILVAFNRKQRLDEF